LNEKIKEIEKIKEELDKLRNELRDVDFGGIERFTTLYKSILALGKYLDAVSELVKEQNKVLELYGKEIEALKAEMNLKGN